MKNSIDELSKKLDELYKKYKQDGVLYLSDAFKELGLNEITVMDMFNSYLKARESKDQA